MNGPRAEIHISSVLKDLLSFQRGVNHSRGFIESKVIAENRTVHLLHGDSYKIYMSYKFP